jgi:hypothetical protein
VGSAAKVRNAPRVGRHMFSTSGFSMALPVDEAKAFAGANWAKVNGAAKQTMETSLADRPRHLGIQAKFSLSPACRALAVNSADLYAFLTSG